MAIEPKKISEWVWEIPKQGNMLVPARVFSSDILIEQIKTDRTLLQAMNVACLKGIQKASLVMPDAHEGYGFPIGGVAAFDLDEGIISPGGVGYDINCGVRLLRTHFKADDIMDKRKDILPQLLREIPAGVGKGGQLTLTHDELKEVVAKGAQWAVDNNYGTKKDLRCMEEYGVMKEADPGFVSPRALARGKSQLGTLGSGNHFLEIQKVAEIYDEKTAKIFGIEKDQVTIMIHTGSRGFGHQIATDYMRKMEAKYGFAHLPDRELINAPFYSDLGQDYLKAMSCAINFGFVNRQMIMHWVREVFKKVMGDSDISLIYGVCHNLAKVEKHRIDGQMKKVCVHRKGATRAFGPGREEIPEIYREVGQPVLIPGSMGTASYLCVGTREAEEQSFGSAAHGAGRKHSRSWARQHFKGEQIKKEMAQKNIQVLSTTSKGLVEEYDPAYKDIHEVIRVSHGAKLAKKVAKLVPLGVVKG